MLHTLHNDPYVNHATRFDGRLLVKKYVSSNILFKKINIDHEMHELG